MAKTKTYLLYLLLYCCSISCYGNDSELERINKVQKVYTSLIGVKELTGRNDGFMVEKIQKAAGIKKGDPWCAATVCFSFVEAGVKAIISGYCPNWFPAKKTIYTRGKKNNLTPRTADVFGLFFVDMGRIAHEGFIDEWPPDSSMAITVEGNTNKDGSREGNGCFKKKRLKKQFYKISRWT